MKTIAFNTDSSSCFESNLSNVVTDNHRLWLFALAGLFSATTTAQQVPIEYELNPNQQAVSNGVFNSNLSLYCSENDSTNPFCSASPSSISDLKSLTPDQVFAMGSLTTRITGGKLTQPNDYTRFGFGKSTGGGSGDDDFSPLGFWAKVDSDFGSRANTFEQSGFKFDNHHFVFGADYRLQDNWVVGSSFGYRHNTADFVNNRGNTVNDNYTGSLYTTYNITDALHVEATASYAGAQYETLRNISLGGVNSVATAKPEGNQYAFSWGGGYDFNHGALSIGPYARGEYINLDIDGYSETGSIAAVRFGKQNIESLVSTVGVQTAYTFSMPWGVLIPQLRGEWHHQFMDGQRAVQGSFVADPLQQSFSLLSDGPTRDYYTFGASVSSVLPGGISAFLAYETLQSYTTINSNKLMLGARLEF